MWVFFLAARYTLAIVTLLTTIQTMIQRTQRKRYAAVGTGGRLVNFTTRLVKEYSDTAEIVGLCDISQVRMDYHNRELGELGCPAVPTYPAADFDRMLEETKPDVLIVCTKDCHHHDYIIRGLKKGVEIITEKPMTTDAEKCQAVLDAVKATQGRCRVTFNYRFKNIITKVKELIATGTIGAVKSVNMEYLLDTRHGADYYRRWHSEMASSGGLLVHKSTHHFDLVNWWIDAIPQQVFAYGQLDFYGKANALARGDEALTRYDRYTGVAEAAKDPFALDLNANEKLRERYLKAEQETGYLRDRNVFRDGIDIFDNMSVNVRYRSGELLTYSLVSFSPREGMRVTFNGDRGRIEFNEYHGSHIIRGQSEEELEKELKSGRLEDNIMVFPHFKDPYQVPPVKAAAGGHGGADPVLGEQLFAAEPPEEPWQRNAGHEQGAASILIGIAANQSIAKNRPVNILDLVSLNPQAKRLHDLA